MLTTFTEYKLWKCYKTENSNYQFFYLANLFNSTNLITKDQLLERTLSESSKSYLKTLNNNSLFQYFNVSFLLKIANQKFVLIKFKFLENFNSKLVQLSPCIKNKHSH